MPVYIVTGKLGGGKSIVSVARIKDYLARGCRVATNLDIRLHHMWGKDERKLDLMRLPDQPTVHDLRMIGNGNPSYDESKNGLLVLDECGTWFNARNWQDNSRKDVNDWFLHARKFGWDVILIIQDIDILDSQARKCIAEHTVFCKRTDRLSIPLIGTWWKVMTGSPLRLPKMHLGKVIYGTSEKDPVADRWWSYGAGLYQCYDTKQAFIHRDLDAPDYFGTHCLLTPWHLLGRYRKPFDLERVMRLTHIYLKRWSVPVAIAAGCFAGFVAAVFSLPYFINMVQEAGNANSELVAAQESGGDAGAGDVESNAAGSVVDSADEVSSVSAVFSGFTIAAHVRNARSQYYMISNREGAQFTDSQLVSMGYRVFFVNECEMMISAANDFTDKTNVFAPGCVPKPVGHVGLDLSEFPTMAEAVVPLVPTKQWQPDPALARLNSLTVNDSTLDVPTL